MAPAAYGAFVLHPPVIVGLAYAMAPLPLPAELKFSALLVTGSAGSFGLAALASRARPTAVIVGASPRSEWKLASARPSERAAPRPAATPPSA